MTTVDEDLAKLHHTLTALREHARLQGSELTFLVFPAMDGNFIAALTFYPEATDPLCRVSVEVEGMDRNDIITKLKNRLEMVRKNFSVLLGPSTGGKPL